MAKIVMTIEFDSGETSIEHVVRQTFPHLFPQPVAVQKLYPTHGAVGAMLDKTQLAREVDEGLGRDTTPNEGSSAPNDTVPTDEQIVAVTKRAIDFKGLGLGYVRSVLKEFGVKTASALAPDQKAVYADTLLKALGE